MTVLNNSKNHAPCRLADSKCCCVRALAEHFVRLRLVGHPAIGAGLNFTGVGRAAGAQCRFFVAFTTLRSGLP